jgi:tRNA threonylcarbamoyladenosine biosynthesis protein TsaB
MILSLETSTSVCSVALHQEGKVISYAEIFVPHAHSDNLSSMLKNVLEQGKCKMTDLQAVAISKGPGSYTGLRIGTSAAKGLCFALDIPLIAINTLKALAAQMQSEIYSLIQDENALLCPLLDARREEVYRAIFDNELNEVLATEAKVIEKDTFEELLTKQKIVFFGNGAEKTKGLITANEQAIFVPNIENSSLGMGKLAFEKFQKQDFEDLAYFEPFYLKDFIAIKPRKDKYFKQK